MKASPRDVPLAIARYSESPPRQWGKGANDPAKNSKKISMPTRKHRQVYNYIVPANLTDELTIFPGM